MNGLVLFVVFFAGWILGVLTMMWGEDDPVQPEDIRRKLDRWDGTR